MPLQYETGVQVIIRSQTDIPCKGKDFYYTDFSEPKKPNTTNKQTKINKWLTWFGLETVTK